MVCIHMVCVCADIWKYMYTYAWIVCISQCIYVHSYAYIHRQVYIYLFLYIFVYVHMYACICRWMCLLISLCMYNYIYNKSVHMYIIYTHRDMQTYTYVCISECISVYPCVYICTQMHIWYVYMHLCACVVSINRQISLYVSNMIVIRGISILYVYIFLMQYTFYYFVLIHSHIAKAV